MNACTIIAFVYDGGVYCPRCAAAAGETEDDELWVAVFPGEGWDTIPTCDTCAMCIGDVTLTAEGIDDTLANLEDTDPEGDYYAVAVDVLRRHGVEYVDGAGFVGPGPDDSAQSLPDWYRERYTSRD